MRRILDAMVWGGLLLLAACSTASTGVDQAADLADGQIYAAVVRQIYHVDHSFSEPPGWPFVYLLRSTEDSLVPPEMMGEPRLLADGVQQAVLSALDELPAEVQWVDGHEDVPIDSNTGLIRDGQAVLISLGNIHAREDGQVWVSFFMSCGNLCGIGKVYIIEEVDGVWQVTGSTGPEVMS